jgi:hypothetical protein
MVYKKTYPNKAKALNAKESYGSLEKSIGKKFIFFPDNPGGFQFFDSLF